jgi:hypothetical protein
MKSRADGTQIQKDQVGGENRDYGSFGKGAWDRLEDAIMP